MSITTMDADSTCLDTAPFIGEHVSHIHSFSTFILFFIAACPIHHSTARGPREATDEHSPCTSDDGSYHCTID
jgi:hypothetical protein